MKSQQTIQHAQALLQAYVVKQEPLVSTMNYVLVRLEVLLEDTFTVLAQKKPGHLQAVRNIIPTVGTSQVQNPSRKSNQGCLQTMQQQVSTTPSPMPVSSAVKMKASAAKATPSQVATAKPVMASSQSQALTQIHEAPGLDVLRDSEFS
jgi:hypothetical protein